MLLPKRPLATAGAAVLLALSLTACGGDSPSDASVKDYCDAVRGDTNNEAFAKALEDKDYDKIVDLFKEQAEKVEEVGTPKDISDDAREGFEIQLDAIKDIDGDDVKKAFESNGDSDPFEDKISKDDKKKVEAYTKYESETCSDSDSVPTPDVPTEVPTDGLPTDGLPTDGLPTDGLPSGFPSDLPTDPAELESLLSNLPTEIPTS
ncbi:hypothetical protein ACFJIY_14020 [Pimelobacter simplex]|uniref:hypothetical protein n=1 Tax=Nocardioides simplex TaxID=2045 RepID=UPI00366D2DA5